MIMCDSNSDIESIDETLSDIRDSAASDTNFLKLNEKTKKIYDKYYKDFIDWKISNKRQSFKEEVVLEYFVEKSHKYKSSTLATIFSILRTTLSQNHNVYISRYKAVIAFLKHNAEGYTGKKSNTFSPEDIYKFLREAPDSEYLCAKVALVFGIVGGCRMLQLYQLQFKDVEVLGSRILVNVKNRNTRMHRVFTLTGDFYKLCKKYIGLRPDPCPYTTFFLQYKSGKCFSQSIGINHFGQLGKSVAKFLGLPNPELYTGHCFRKTSARILVDTDGDILPNRGHIRYKTTKASGRESCVQDSTQSSFENESIENINKTSTTVLEDCSNNTIESIIEECTNSFENKNIGYVNVDIPIANLREGIDKSMENKDKTRKEANLSFSNESNDFINTNTSGTSVIEDYLDDSMDENQTRNQYQNPLADNTDKVININIPRTSSNLKQALETLVRFDNCSIQNVKINNYNK